MKLTPELIARSESTLNALGDRQLTLRGLKIPAIENLGVTRDANDTLDLTDNDVRALTNFPTLKRIRTLIMTNNLVNRIDRRLANMLPSLQYLILTNNAMADVASLDPLGRLAQLHTLSLMGNPVTTKEHYRDFVIWRCKALHVLDFQPVKEAERQRAKGLMETEEGRPSALALSLSAQLAGSARDTIMTDGRDLRAKTFDVGAPSNGLVASAGRRMTPEERKALEEAIENSTSLEEIKRLEDRLRMGYAV